MQTRSDAPKRERVREMKEQGLTPRQIALILGISTQRVYQHLKRIKDDQEKAS